MQLGAIGCEYGAAEWWSDGVMWGQGLGRRGFAGTGISRVRIRGSGFIGVKKLLRFTQIWSDAVRQGGE